MLGESLPWVATELDTRSLSTRCRPTRARRLTRSAIGAGILLYAMAGVASATGAQGVQGTAGPRVLSTTVEGAITPVVANHVADGIARAERDGYDAYLIRLDTPGGLDTSMREIVQDVLASEVPVIVYVSPRGARAASAGAIITFAGHVAAMAPGTAIGAATPVGGGGGEDLDRKVLNDAIAYVEALAELRGRDEAFLVDTVREGRSASASDALEVGAIDLVAASTIDLLDQVDGIVTTVGADDREVELTTAGAEVDDQSMGLLRRIQQFLADPNVAFLLLSIGTLGLVYELASPGIGVGGVLGVVFVVLALFGLAVLPVDFVGVIFLLLAVALFVAEVFAPGIGIAAAGGAFALVLSGIFLFDDTPGLELSLSVLLPTAIVAGTFVVLAGRLAMRARRAPSTTTGVGMLIGNRAQVHLAHDGRPQVFTLGAWWGVRPHDPGDAIPPGTTVEIVEVDGLQLVVDPVQTATPDGGNEPTSEDTT